MGFTQKEKSFYNVKGYQNYRDNKKNYLPFGKNTFKTFIISVDPEGKAHERKIYDLLNFVGNVGGLSDGLTYIATILNLILSSGLIHIFKADLYFEINSNENYY